MLKLTEYRAVAILIGFESVYQESFGPSPDDKYSYKGIQKAEREILKQIRTLYPNLAECYKYTLYKNLNNS